MIETAAFGSTGHLSSRVIFGAAALGAMSQERSDKTIELVRAAGVNHFDTAADYGQSEDRLEPWLSSHRGEVFLATKTGDRDGPGARASLERSLERMGVDHVDLIQLHNLVEDGEWATAHRTGGAVQALAQARDEGLVRFIGITGHGTRVSRFHLRSLAEFDFDSVLIPYNFTMMQNPQYRADTEELLALCSDRGVAVQTIKAIARGRWPEGQDGIAESRGPRFSWYQPLEDEAAIGRSVRHILGNEQLFLNTTSDATKLPMVLAAAAANGMAPTEQELQTDTDTFSITPLFDGKELERI